MSDFRTTLNPIPSAQNINHSQSIFSIGSCFAEHMAARMTSLKFDILPNPFGILFNPISIAHTLERILDATAFAENELFLHNSLWHSFTHHSSFSGINKKEVLQRINQELQLANTFLKKTDWLICTLGTAYVFEWKKENRIVANCHKLPNDQFLRRRLEIEEITSALSKVFRQLTTQNDQLQIILTLSPVRHIRDGLIENQRSKATLALAIEALQQKFSAIHYFPAYELILDDLRDYRFYKQDMIHPNETAIEYVWEHFKSIYFDSSTAEKAQQFHKLAHAIAHRPLHPKSDAHQLFLKNQLSKITQFEKEFPKLSFEKEKLILEKQLI